MDESTKKDPITAATNAASRAKAAATAAAPTSAKDAAEKAKSAAYTVVGLGVMGAAKVQSGAKHLAESVRSKDLGEHVSTLKDQAGKVAKATTETAQKADQHLESVITKAEERLAPLGDRLPDQARDLVRRAQDTGRETRAKVRSTIFTAEQPGTTEKADDQG